MSLEYIDFDLELSILSGQCFEWRKNNEWFYGEIKPGSIIKIKQVGTSYKGKLVYEVFGKPVTLNEIKRYFSLNSNYADIVSSFLQTDDLFMQKAVQKLHGLRLINQDPWRCTISFIISANNNVKNITKSVLAISETYGEAISTDIGTIYGFPRFDTFVQISESSLRELKLGFRSKYLANLKKYITNPLIFYENLCNKSYLEAKESLIKIEGIGTKVADCILLYSLYKYEAYPVDVWVRRVTLECYFKFNEKISNEKIREWARDYFGINAGIAHMFLFVYRRSIGEIL